MQRMLVGGVVFLGAIACGGGSASTDGGGTNTQPTTATAVKDEGFSHACAKDDDCVVAFFGSTCSICSGSNAAIAKSAQGSWQQAYNTAHGNCPNDGEVGKCAPSYGVSRCNEQKVCTFVDCNGQRPADDHHCATDGGR